MVVRTVQSPAAGNTSPGHRIHTTWTRDGRRLSLDRNLFTPAEIAFIERLSPGDVEELMKPDEDGLSTDLIQDIKHLAAMWAIADELRKVPR